MNIRADKHWRALQYFEKDWKQLVECRLVETPAAVGIYVISELYGAVEL